MMQAATTNAMNYFEKIYIINLPLREDRRREMDEQLKNIGLSLDSPYVEIFPAIRPESTGGFPSIGARGCFMSHLGVLRAAKLAGYERILILEDDVDFEPNFNSRIVDILNNLKHQTWSIFYGGYELLNAKAQSSEITCSVNSVEPIRTTHFLAVQGSAIAALATYLEAMLARSPGHADGGPMHVDGAYSWFRRENPSMVTLIAQPELGHQRPSRTDIHDLNWYDRIVGIRQLVQLLRKLKRHYLKLKIN